ncbi:AAA family ATPase [Streptomyces phaeochromogenes]|uniref:AAA family ATPase n=1 Tax=Streptomyces phaeochromogenes TaxID=1923 RepID=UPI002DDB977A|nr:AAA family ATPase [Streptomyces phaeochromogenes]WRZ31437.1 ATP-binding protein [Streptomyces phaeochromogenes]WSW15508.1 ATP-binding protein [Streptomyces phaeochromogenes]WTA05975.1 ATP-binding protein [Streptomyces phaeochromogenes]
MLLWINGPFGGGKTQTAYELQRRLPGSVVCDPEHAGFGLRRMLPPELRGNFQDLASWRQGVVEVLDLALTKHDGVVVAPMTVTDFGYFDETVGLLREKGHDVRHFTLLAERETVLKRLRERGFGHLLQYVAGKDAPLRRESWAVEQLDHCLERLREPEFAEHLWTDDTTVARTADRIAVLAGLTLAPNKDGALRGRLRRSWTSARHIRFD